MIIKKNKEKESHKYIRNMIIIKHTQVKKDVPNVVIHNIEKDLDVQLASTNVKIAISIVISVACATRREKHMTRKGLWSQDHPKQKQLQIGPVYMQDSIYSQSEDLSSSSDSFCLQLHLQSTQVETIIPAPDILLQM